MTNPTSNYGWQMPTSTDLVTDLPADFEVFGQAVDTSLLGLKGGTTGQVLSKTSGTDMAFTWIPVSEGDITGVTAGAGITGGGTSGTVTVTNSMATTIDAKGDLIGGTADNAFERLAVGANDTVLTADSTTATGMKWAAAAGGGGKVLQVVLGTTASPNSSSTQTYVDTSLTATITPTLSSSKVLVLYTQNGCFKSAGAANNALSLQLHRSGSSILNIVNTGMATVGAFSLNGFGLSGAYLDSPATTSATIYKTRFRNFWAASSVQVQADGPDSVSTIILMEIGV